MTNSSPSRGAEGSVRIHLTAADRALGTGDRLGAVAALECAAEADPDDEQALLTAASLCLQEGLPGRSARLAIRAVERRPFNPPAINLLAVAAIVAGHFDRARSLLERLRRAAPSFDAARQNLESLCERETVPTADLAAGDPFPASAMDRLDPEDRPKLTACILAREGDRDGVAISVESISGLADEILVGDAGAGVDLSDRSHVIALSWNHDVSAARNALIGKARGDWVLMLDAYDRLDSDAVEAVRLAMAGEGALFHFLEIRTDGEEGSHLEPRLFRNAVGVAYEGKILERPTRSLAGLAAGWGLGYGLPPAVVSQPNLRSRPEALAGRRRDVEAVLAADPGDAAAALAAARLEAEAEHPEAALDHLRRAVGDERLAERRALEAECRIRLGGFDEALALLEAHHADYEPNLDTRFLEGVACLATGRAERAARCLEEAVARRADVGEARPLAEAAGAGPFAALAESRLLLDDIEGGRVAYAEAIARFPADILARIGMIRLRFVARELSAAAEELVQLVRQHGDDPRVWIEGHALLAADPVFSEASRRWAEEAVRRFPGNDEIRRGLGLPLEAPGEDAAVPGEASLERAWTTALEGRLEEAGSMARRASADGADASGCGVLEAWCLVALDRHEEALRLLEPHHDRFPPTLDSLFLEGAASWATGQMERAAASLRKAADRWHSERESARVPGAAGAELFNLLAAALVGVSDIEGARSAYREALKVDPASVEGQAGLLCLRMASGERREAIDGLLSLARERGEDPRVWTDGYAILSMDPSLAVTAGAWIEEAARRFPAHPHVARLLDQAKARSWMPLGDPQTPPAPEAATSP